MRRPGFIAFEANPLPLVLVISSPARLSSCGDLAGGRPDIRSLGDFGCLGAKAHAHQSIQRPSHLTNLAHKKLDADVFAAYGWPGDLSDELILEELLGLNVERAKEK